MLKLSSKYALPCGDGPDIDTIISANSSPVASMNEERAKASFDIHALTVLMDGGQKQTDVNTEKRAN